MILPVGHKRLIPVAAFLAFGSVAFFLWWMLSSHQRELLLHHNRTTAEQVRTRIEGLMNTRIASLQLLADRWVERDPPDFSEKRFLHFSEALLRHYPGFSAIQWINPDGHIRWVFPESMNRGADGASIDESTDPKVRIAFDLSRHSGRYSITPCFDIAQDRKGFQVFLPLVYNGELQGYLGGVFIVDEIMSISLPKGLTDDFAIKLYEDGLRIYQVMASDRHTVATALETIRDVEFGGRDWQLQVAPYDYSPVSLGSALTLGFGLMLSAALSFLTYLLIGRMEMYRESRDFALHEISERKKIEAALLENEKRLNETLEELNARNAEMESFVYTVSHDLKTPIVTIEGFIGALREDFGTCLLNEEAERYLKYMSDAALKMESLINDLLSLSRVGRITEKKTVFPLADIVREALDMLKPQIDARGIRVEVREDLPAVCGERKRIVQVMDNLLSNAVKYIGAGNPSPRIEVGSEEKNGQKVFFVRDNGIGVEERYFDKIFQIFQRLPAAKQAGEGTGMGLTIARKIVEHHGGSMWIESVPGRGSTFFFTLSDEDSR